MKAKLTLRMEEELVERAKSEAKRRGKSVSRMVADYFDTLGAVREKTVHESLPPVTSSLAGVAKDHSLSIEDYRRHLRTKHQ